MLVGLDCVVNDEWMVAGRIFNCMIPFAVSLYTLFCVFRLEDSYLLACWFNEPQHGRLSDRIGLFMMGFLLLVGGRE